MAAPPRACGLITLLTDFGVRDEYVGCLKGVILGLNPRAVLVDLSHEVPPQDIRAGAFILAATAPFFPTGTIHLAVVDPGVGTSRRPLAARCRGQFWVGPDNGLFHLIFAGQGDLEIVSLENPAYFRPQVAATFHGRDLFAPVAAHLSLGVDLRQLGPTVTDPIRLPWPEPTFTAKIIRGEIIHVDRFGNLVSNIAAAGFHSWRREANFSYRWGQPPCPACTAPMARRRRESYWSWRVAMATWRSPPPRAAPPYSSRLEWVCPWRSNGNEAGPRSLIFAAEKSYGLTVTYSNERKSFSRM